MAKTYATVVGVILLIWGVIGLFTSSFLGIATSGLQVWLFIVAGALGVWMGMSGKNVKGYAKVFGIIFILGGVLGFLAPGINEALTLDSGGVANVVHLLAGIWGLWAGFGKGSAPASAMPTGGNN